MADYIIRCDSCQRQIARVRVPAFVPLADYESAFSAAVMLCADCKQALTSLLARESAARGR